MSLSRLLKEMNEDSRPNDSRQPIVMRWKESVADGHHHWFLAALESDGQFWGYVHIRSETVSENRSFVGQLDELKYTQIDQIIGKITPNANDIDDNDRCVGILGLGTQAKFKTLTKYRAGTMFAESFLEIVSIMLPEMKLAADLIA